MTIAEDSVPATGTKAALVHAFAQGMLVHRMATVALLAVYETLTREQFQDLAGTMYDAQVELLQAGVDAYLDKPAHGTEREDK